MKKTMKNVKATVGLGIGSMGGMLTLGTMESLPGMPASAKGVSAIATTGLNLANVGQLSKTAMGVVDSFKTKKSSKTKLKW
jgi:hypothetical protein